MELYLKLKTTYRDHFTVIPLSCDGLKGFFLFLLTMKTLRLWTAPKTECPPASVILREIKIFLNGLLHVPSVHSSLRNSPQFLGVEPAHTSLCSPHDTGKKRRKGWCLHGLQNLKLVCFALDWWQISGFGFGPRIGPPPWEGSRGELLENFKPRGNFPLYGQVTGSRSHCSWGKSSTLASGGSQGCLSSRGILAAGADQDGVQELGATRFHHENPNLCKTPKSQTPNPPNLREEKVPSRLAPLQQLGWTRRYVCAKTKLIFSLLEEIKWLLLSWCSVKAWVMGGRETILCSSSPRCIMYWAEL